MQLAVCALLPGATAFGAAHLPRSPPALTVGRPPALTVGRTPAVVTMQQPSASDRAAASLVYLLPALDGFGYGTYVYQNIPPLGAVAYQLLPIVNGFESLPFGGLVLFIGLSFFTRNQGLSRFVRFNIQQALLLDIALIIPDLFTPVTKIFPYELQAMGTNFVFYAWLGVAAYSVVQNLQGRTPDQVPILSEAASQGIGPF